MAKLSGGVAIIKVGAATEVELKEKKARVEDALSATRAAVEEGIVPGGGTVLVRAAEAIEAIAHGNASESRVIGKAIEDIRLPLGATISAIVRGDDVMMAHHDTVIESDDHVILFILKSG